MRPIKILILATATALAAKMLPAYAADSAEEAFDRMDPSRMIGRVLNDQTLSLVFGYVRRNLAATAEGRTPEPPPEALVKRMDEAAQTLRKEGSAAAVSMLDEFERELKRALREDFRDR